MSDPNVSDSPSEAASTPQPTDSVQLSRSSFIALLAAGLVLCFFLPWVNLFIAKVSGFQFQKEFGSRAVLLWLMPFLAAFPVLASIIRSEHTNLIAKLAGVSPFLILAYALYTDGRDVFRILEPAAWASLVIGLILCIVSRK